MLFNCTFYLSSQETDKKQVFVKFTKVFVDYIRRMIVMIGDKLDDKHVDILYNMCLNILISLANPSNYAYEFKQVLKMEKFNFDWSEVKFLNDNMDKFLENIEVNDVVRVVTIGSI